MRLTWFLILLICLSSDGFAQAVAGTPAVVVRNFSAQKIQGYKEDTDFQYQTVNEPSQTAWGRFWEWVWSRIDEIMNKPGAGKILKAIFILLASALLVFFVLKLSGMNKAGFWSKKNAGASFSYTVNEEDIHAINFAEALQQAISQGNYRVAIRLMYLQSLKHLADRQLINWQIDKTNTAYLDELKDEGLRQHFYRLTLQFENNWYGNIPVREQEFAGVREAFESFNRQLT